MMYKVNSFHIPQYLAKRYFSKVYQQKPLKLLYPLESRRLIKVSGHDAPVFLQGLITNDMQHFEEGASSMYAMFLNNKGRVLYDTLIHKWEGSDSFLLECDKNVYSSLQRHLKIYKLKRNIEIADGTEDLRLFALITPTEIELDKTIHPKRNVNIYKDPRLAALGHRLIASPTVDHAYIQSLLGDNTVIANDETGYKYLRFKLGVSEGAHDLPAGVCFPLEANCDYLHGVSFHKGCYIGQEVTARVHHTGVVRKRIMPIQFTDVIQETIENDSVITVNDEKNSKIGKFKSWVNDYGLGIVRVKEALEAKSLSVGQHTVKVIKPDWWPFEAPKDKVTAKLQPE